MSFFANLFGGKSGKNAANAAAEAQQAANARARTDITDGFTSAQGRVQPYAEAGRRGFNLYNDAIGVNGEAGYKNALTNFNADPFLAGQDDAAARGLRSTFRRYNSQGMGNSGASGAAVARYAGDDYARRVADYRNRLMGAGQGGQQMAQFQSGLDTQQGQMLSGNSMNTGNIEAQRLANIYQAQQQGMNNLLGMVGGIGNFALAGFAPGAKGGTAFGNMRNALMG